MQSFVLLPRRTAALTVLIAGLACAASCKSFFDPESSDDKMGEMILGFEKEMYLQTKAVSDLPDTNDFVLTVRSSSGNTLYNGRYGSAPMSIMANEGSYTVTVVSAEFKAPAWSSPQFGDTQEVTVKSSQSTAIELLCKQLNSGVRLNISPDFLTAYPGGALLLKSADGNLLYSYSERRIAFFNPGSVSLVLSDSGKDQTLLTRTLLPQEILSINVKVQKSTSEGASLGIQIDTSRNWTSTDYVLGGDNPSPDSGGRDGALSVSEARTMGGTKDIWVYGYIVGGDLTSSNASFTKPFSSKTNIVIAPKASVTDRSLCMSVQLKSGTVRDQLNLVDHPENLGHLVFLRGDIVASYYGLPGIQNISELELN